MITLTHTTRAEVLLPCARCHRLHPLDALVRVEALGLWVCRDRHACWFAVRANELTAAALRAEAGEAA